MRQWYRWAIAGTSCSRSVEMTDAGAEQPGLRETDGLSRMQKGGKAVSPAFRDSVAGSLGFRAPEWF